MSSFEADVAATVQEDHDKDASVEELLSIAAELQLAGRASDAEQLCRQVLAQVAPVQEALGTLRLDAGDFETALALLLSAVSLEPENPRMRVSLGNALFKAGKLDPARRHAMKAIERDPGFAQAWRLLADIDFEAGRFAGCAQLLKDSIETGASQPGIWGNRGVALLMSGAHTEALAVLRKAVELEPDDVAARANLVACLGGLARHEDVREAARDAPLKAREYQLLYAVADSGITPVEVADLHNSYGAALEAQEIDKLCEHSETRSPRAKRALHGDHDNDRSCDRRLRVGYLSGDFKDHSVSFFLAPLLQNHDPEAVDVVCYSTTRDEDATTRRLRAKGPEWRACAELDDDALESRIRDDKIDILVDLSGYTVGHRVNVLIRKPAPVQVAYLGYPSTRASS